MVRFAFQVVKNQETPNIVCSFDNFRYIFNIPDGFQRFVKDNNIKINPAPRIFFTRNSTQTLSGCFGYLHTLLAQNCAIGTKIYGPRGIYNLFNMKRYNEIGGFKTLPYSFQEINGKLLLGTKDTKLIEELLQQNDCLLQEFLEKIKEHVINPAESNNAAIYMKTPTLFQDENITIQCVETVNYIQYILTSPKQSGNVSKEKLKEYQLSGKNMALLMKQGFAETEAGQIVKIEEIKEPDILPQSVIILDIVDEEQLVKFMNSQEFSSLLQRTQNKQEDLVCMFHLSHSIHEPFYIEFLSKFANFKHILCNYEEYKTDELTKLYQDFQPLSEIIASALNAQFPSNFPQISRMKLHNIPEQLKQFNNISGYIPLFEYRICPTKQQGYKPIQNFAPKDIINCIKQVDVQQIFQQDKQDFLKLIFLGTCSMKPGQYRNVSGIIVVNEKQKSNIILDCGEGTGKQIYDESLDMMDKPLIIWISHAHSDHHMGILQLLFDLSKSKSEIFLIIPAVVLPWITLYQTIIGEQFKCQIILTQQFDEDFKDDLNILVESTYKQCRVRQGENILSNQFINFQQNFENLKKQMKQAFDLESIKVTAVEHCPQAYGIRLNFVDNRSITYSGDTRPCQQFVRLSQNANVLIHEATFTDDLQENAQQNMHSTISEAIQVGMESQAEVIALTHYSQRYSKQIEIKQEHLQNDKVVFSCDHFGGYLNEYSQLSKLSKEIIQIFND